VTLTSYVPWVTPGNVTSPTEFVGPWRLVVRMETEAPGSAFPRKSVTMTWRFPVVDVVGRRTRPTLLLWPAVTTTPFASAGK